MARPFRIDFGCTMTEITRRGEASLLLGRQDSQGIGEGKFTIQDLTPHSADDILNSVKRFCLATRKTAEIQTEISGISESGHSLRTPGGPRREARFPLRSRCRHVAGHRNRRRSSTGLWLRRFGPARVFFRLRS